MLKVVVKVNTTCKFGCCLSWTSKYFTVSAISGNKTKWISLPQGKTNMRIKIK